MNTYFRKPEQPIITYKDNKAHPGGPPYTRECFEMIDYVIIPNRWKNSIKHVESDIHANINTDHFPIKVKIIIDLKAKYVKDKTTYEYDECLEYQQQQ